MKKRTEYSIKQHTCLISEKKIEEIVTSEKTSIGIETDRQDTPEKALIEDDQRRSLLKNSRAIAETNNITEEKGVRKYFVKKKQAEELAREKIAGEKMIASTSVANDKTRLYDPLASLELHSVTYQVKRHEKPVVEKLTWQSGTAETCIDDKKTAEFGEDIEMVQKSAHVSANKIKKSTTISEKSIQTNLRKSEKYRRYDKISHIDTKIHRAADLGKKEKKEERRQKKWIDKQRKQR